MGSRDETMRTRHHKQAQAVHGEDNTNGWKQGLDVRRRSVT
jgi:hypothetical protein